MDRPAVRGGGSDAHSSGFPHDLTGIDGVVESPSMFSERPALWVNGTEIAHFDGPRLLDVRLTRGEIRATRSRLRAEGRVHLRASSSSDWIEVEVPGEVEGDDLVHELVEQAVAAHRAQPGKAPMPPATGEALARRHRFH